MMLFGLMFVAMLVFVFVLVLVFEVLWCQMLSGEMLGCMIGFRETGILVGQSILAVGVGISGKCCLRSGSPVLVERLQIERGVVGHSNAIASIPMRSSIGIVHVRTIARNRTLGLGFPAFLVLLLVLGEGQVRLVKDLIRVGADYTSHMWVRQLDLCRVFE